MLLVVDYKKYGKKKKSSRCEFPFLKLSRKRVKGKGRILYF